MSNLVLRILTGVVGAILLVAALLAGPWWFGGLIIAVSLTAQYEFYGLFRQSDHPPFTIPGLLIGLLLLIRFIFPGALDIITGIIVILLLAATFSRQDGNQWTRLSYTAMGIVYPIVFASYVIMLRLGIRLPVSEIEAMHLTASLLFMVFSSDVFAYFAGRSMGSTPLAPVISPKKTVEGSIGGILGSVGVAVALKIFGWLALAWVHVIALGLICSIFGQLGDLAESRLKRTYKIKDSGSILPGHGGFLDRIDAALFVAPVYYYYLLVFVW